MVCSLEGGLRVSPGTVTGEGFIVSAMGKPRAGLRSNGMGCTFMTPICPSLEGGRVETRDDH